MGIKGDDLHDEFDHGDFSLFNDDADDLMDLDEERYEGLWFS